MRRVPFVLILLLTAVLSGAVPALGHPVEPGDGKDAPAAEQDPDFPASSDAPSASSRPCVDGVAGYFPCDDVNLASFLPMSEIGGGRGSDVWGWTDPETERSTSASRLPRPSLGVSPPTATPTTPSA